jgi:hypothetical protein
MKTRFDEKLENDPRPSRAIVAGYRARICDEQDEAELTLVTYRGTQEELDIGLEYSRSLDPLDRVTGADVLAQLGWSDCSFPDESVGRLIELLEDADTRVISSAAIGLGHRGDPRAIPHLVTLAEHPDLVVRLALALGLAGHEDERAVAALLNLARDEDPDVRNWAVFGLGSQIEIDTPEIRAALRSALDDADSEIRGEALVGLANRSEPNLPVLLLRELREHGNPGPLCLEAIETVLGPEFERLMNEEAHDAAELSEPPLRDKLIAALEKAAVGP